MPTLERRITPRLIMNVPLKFRPVQAPDGSEKDAASMNIWGRRDRMVFHWPRRACRTAGKPRW